MASWIIRRKSDKAVVCETFNKKLTEKINKYLYEAVPIIDYLAEINKQIKK